jgi:hypothetical protein
LSIPFQIGGAQTVIPGVYSSFSVSNSLLAPVPAGRSIVILGEAEEGVPGAELDLRGSRYTDFADVKDQFKSGAIVDAARQIFSNQPAQIFSGAVQALYIYKTNASLRAEKLISAPSNFGSLVASRYGKAGNQIKSQIKTGQAESKPSKTFVYLPSPSARSFKVSVNGVVSSALSVSAEGLASDFVTALAGVSGLSTTGGTIRTTITSGPMTVDTTVSGDQLTLTRSGGSALFDTSITAGDSCYIDTGLPISAGSNQNSGSWVVVSKTTTTLVLKQLKTNEINAQALAVLTGISVAASDLKINAPVVMTVTATTADGSGASLEVLENTADKLALGILAINNEASIIPSSAAATAKIAASVPSVGKITLSLSTGSWSSTPKVGDLIYIGRGSLVEGATLKNVGLMVVESASARSITASHLFSGMTTETVTSVSLNGNTSSVMSGASFVSSSVASRRIDSSAEKKVKIEASRSTDGASVPTSLIGGTVALEIGYYQAGATACTAVIDSTRTLTITPVGAGSVIAVKTLKYKTLQDLADFLNAQTGVSAKVPDNRFKSLSPSVLDMASVGVLDGQAVPSYTGKIKKDYYDWKQFFVDNFSLLAFKEGTLVLKSGLPTAESTAGFLTGAVIGATDMSSIQSGLDQALKVEARIVVPLFSRDAQYDIEDGNTDEGSSYTIDAINAAVKSHVATASSTLFRKERFGYVSWDGSFEDAKQKVGEMAYERVKMGFMRHQATDGQGDSVKFLPWMEMCAIAAGRVQAPLGTSMLRKPFNLSSAEHVGQLSLYTDTLVQDFDADDRGELEDAIAAGLVVMRAVSGFGVRMESPDLTSRSRSNDPQGWVWERENVLFTCDEIVATMRNVLENFIGSRTSDIPTAVVKTALESIISTYVGAGALISGKVNNVKSLGNQYSASVSITPTEALEAIVLDVTAERSAT